MKLKFMENTNNSDLYFIYYIRCVRFVEKHAIGSLQRPAVLLTSHGSRSPPKEFHLKFLCATGIQTLHGFLQRPFTSIDPDNVIP